MKTIALLILLLASTSALSQSTRFEQWRVDKANDGSFYAVTANDDGAFIGQYCDPGEDGDCLYLIGMKNRCDGTSEYPAIINSDLGAISISVRCSGDRGNGYYGYVLMNFSKVDDIVRNGARLGIVLPLEGDAFRVYRFSTDGAKNAISAMKRRAVQEPAKVRRGTKGEIL